MKFSLKKIFPFLYRTKFHVQPGHEVELAFVSDGVEYFRFVDNFSCYAERYFAALDAINALEQRVDKDYLKIHIGLTKEYLNKGDLSKIAVLNHNLEERMTHISNVDLLYTLASVWYFSKEENVYTYNYEFAEKKIARWRADKDVLAFFFKSPLRNYLPLSDTFIQNTLPTYTASQRKEWIQILKYHLSTLSGNNSNSALISDIQSKINQLEVLLATD